MRSLRLTMDLTSSKLHQHYRLTVLIAALVSSCYGGWADSVWAADVVLLRNGEVLQGDVVRQGEHVVVRLAGNGSMTLDKLDVQYVGASIRQVYEHLREQVGQSPTAAERTHLAEWCLQHGLFDACDELLTEASTSRGRNAVSHPMAARLAAARTASRALQPNHNPPQPPRPSDAVAPDELVAKQQLAEFHAFVQPLLLNRCAQCHSSTHESLFTLQRPPSGQSARQRLTQANFLAVLGAIERGNFLSSCETAHGGLNEAPNVRWRHRQMDRLTQWVAATMDHLSQHDEDRAGLEDVAGRVESFRS